MLAKCVCWLCYKVDDLEGSEQHMTTKMDGSQWSRSGESVWISSGPVSPSSSSPSKTRPAIDGQPSPAGETNTATGYASKFGLSKQVNI